MFKLKKYFHFRIIVYAFFFVEIVREEDDKMTWQEELKKSITNIDQLAEILHLSNEQKEQYEAVIERFPMMITPYYLSLVDTNNPHDPIGKMCIPSLDEFN